LKEILMSARPKRLTKRLTRLDRLVRSQTAEHRLVQRARIVLLRVYHRLSIAEVARVVGVCRNTVKRWEARWRADRRIASLEDHERSGRPPVILVRAQAVVLSIACRRPEELGRLEGTFRQQDIAEEAAKRGVVVSRPTVQRILARAEVKPHKERYYLFTKKERPDYEARRDAICDAYQRDLPDDEMLVCIDEKTGIQAIGLPEGLPHGGRRAGGNGSPGRIDQHYVRHGSRSLVAAVRPDTGKLVHSAVYPPKGFKSDQMVEFLEALAAKHPNIRVFHVIWDNGATHVSKATKAFLASTPVGQRFTVLYTPAHASWLDLCENFFSRFSRRYLRGKRYDSVEALEKHLDAALDDYQGWASPMAWTYNPRRKAA
jgi:transposase